MKFKAWVEDQEWGGASFDGTSDRYVNGPGYPRSKWQGPQNALGVRPPSNLKHVEDMYKFNRPVYKRMKKKD